MVYAWKSQPAAGGSDEHNDCLHEAIKKCISFYRMPKNGKRPGDLKRSLGLNRDDKYPWTKSDRSRRCLT